jgi:poly(A) polymerase
MYAGHERRTGSRDEDDPSRGPPGSDADEPRRQRGRIPPALLDERAVSVVRRLQHHGHEAYLVGGCVRDLIAGLEPKDFDVATDARPPRIKRLFRNARIIGRRFRLAHICFPGGHVVETSTFRGDPVPEEDPPTEEAEGSADRAGGAREDDPGEGRATPAPSPDLGPGDGRARRAPAERPDENVFGTAPEDARRRDFTVNALFYDPLRDEVLDWVGGLEDLREGVIRSIGDPARRITEDPVRILRAAHFASRLGFALEPRLHAAMRELGHELRRASQARLYVELIKVLNRGFARPTLRRLHDDGVLLHWLPEMRGAFEAEADWPAAPGGTHDEARQGEPPVLPVAHATWNLLGAADRWGLQAHGASDALALAALLAPWLLDGWRAEGRGGFPAWLVFSEEFLRPLCLRMSVPRRTSSELREAAWLLHELRHAPPPRSAARTVRRRAFPEALRLLRLDLMARDADLGLVEAWSREAERAGAPPDGRRGPSAPRSEGRRRRRRGRRGPRPEGGHPAGGVAAEAAAWLPPPEGPVSGPRRPGPARPDAP